jgi:tripartite-type tricarboxylate transporter receptor subunit TctC
MNIHLTRRRVMVSAGGGLSMLALGLPGRAVSQTVPGGTLRIVIGYAPGGGTDVIVRQMADKLKDRINANVLIENRPGASGMLAPVAMKTAPADGSVILFTPGVSTVEQKVTKKSIPFDLDQDLVPVTLAGTVPTVYVVSAAIGVKTLAEYTAWLKANPKLASFGTAAMGSNTHFFGVELGQAIGQPLQPVAYKGTGPLLTDIMAAHVPAGCGGLTSFLQHHRSGKVNILAVSSPKRSNAAPDLPTVADLGFPKLASEGFYAFYAPARTPAPVIDMLNREIRAVLEAPDMRQKLLGLGLESASSYRRARRAACGRPSNAESGRPCRSRRRARTDCKA